MLQHMHVCVQAATPVILQRTIWQQDCLCLATPVPHEWQHCSERQAAL